MDTPGHAAHSRDAEGAASDNLVIRPFLLTGGRTRPEGGDLPVEALVHARPGAERHRDRLRFEARAIVGHCAEPISVAELSARLRVPLGVVRVLVSDLITDGLVVLAARPELSVQTIERIRDRVRAL